MKNDTTFVRMRSGDHLGDAKCRKRAPRSVEFNVFINSIDTNGFRRMKEEGLIYKRCLRFFNFYLGLSYDLSQLSDNFTLFFSTLKDHN